jgi:uncharacterized membrane protein
MGYVIIVLRSLHILGGVFWTGAALTLYAFVMPSVMATQPDSRRFAQHLAAGGLSAWMTIASLATVVGGLALFMPVTGQLEPAVMRTPRGIVLSIAALLGLAAFLEGMAVSAPAARQLGVLAAAVGDRTPTAEQAAQMAALQAKMLRVGRRDAALLALVAVLMASARYL